MSHLLQPRCTTAPQRRWRRSWQATRASVRVRTYVETGSPTSTYRTYPNTRSSGNEAYIYVALYTRTHAHETCIRGSRMSEMQRGLGTWLQRGVALPGRSMATAANRKKTVQLFYDVISPYSWVAFEVLTNYRRPVGAPPTATALYCSVLISFPDPSRKIGSIFPGGSGNETSLVWGACTYKPLWGIYRAYGPRDYI